MRDEAEQKPGRRDVLRALGIGAPAAAAAAAATTIAGPAEARESRDEARKARYQPNSPHIQAYYRTNRY
jgi:sugar (pentulose or hexulose) kinase